LGTFSSGGPKSPHRREAKTEKAVQVLNQFLPAFYSVTLGPDTHSTTIRFDTEKGDVLTVHYGIIQ